MRKYHFAVGRTTALLLVGCRSTSDRLEAKERRLIDEQVSLTRRLRRHELELNLASTGTDTAPRRKRLDKLNEQIAENRFSQRWLEENVRDMRHEHRHRAMDNADHFLRFGPPEPVVETPRRTTDSNFSTAIDR